MAFTPQSRPVSLQSRLVDKGPSITTLWGCCLGLESLALRDPGILCLIPIDREKVQIFALLGMSGLAGLVAVVSTQKLSPSFPMPLGKRGRLGICAGFFCSLLGGGSLAFAATLEAINAKTSVADHALRTQAWLILAVGVASLLPSILCGFAGGLMGGYLGVASQQQRPLSASAESGPGIKWLQLTIAVFAVVGLASPVCLLVKDPVIDPPPPVPIPPPLPPAFRYEPPAEITSAKFGEIHPSFTKTITNVRDLSPIAMSPDGVHLAFGDASGPGSLVCVYDLHRFKQVASIHVPAYPDGNLAWSPDSKSIACTLGDGKARRIWILDVAVGTAIELPRPPGRDIPTGELYWWQPQELAFLPDDEAPLAFDLEKLLFTAVADSPHYQKLAEADQKKWTDGPRSAWPGQSGWRLGLRTLITSAVPPARRNPEMPWEFSGLTVGAYEHPQLPLAVGIRSMTVTEGERLVCSPDGSKIAHLRDGQIEVTYMTKTVCPDLMIEVDMPQSSEEIASSGWSSRVDSKELCVMICAPLKNPLNHAVVGPDYQQVHGFARLHEWNGRKADFILPIHDGRIQPDDVVSTLHSWYAGQISEWKAPGTLNWWAPVRFISSPLPEKINEMELPQLLSFAQEPSSLRVTKAVAKPRPTPPSKTPDIPPPPPPVLVTEEDVKAFLTEHHAKASRGDVSGMMMDYDSTVDFLDKGRIPAAAIEADEKAHRQKWPKGSEQVVGTISVSEQTGTWSAAYTMAFSNENTAGEWHKGRADLVMTMRVEGQKLFITSQRAKVYDVTDSRASASKASVPFVIHPAAPKAAPTPKGVTITVPRPCFIMSFRAKDTPQIEINDQISFVNGIVWHRTFRELSADGKVLRTCRAIYEGEGGVSEDRSGAYIYVHTQEWDRNLGGGTFTGVCQRKARSLVGQRFQFQFVTGGMVESQLGMVFQLQK